MRHVRIPLLLAVVLLWLIPAEITACGDKYLRLASRLGPAYRAQHPASVLIYMPDQSVVPGVAKALNLHGLLRQAGHEVRAVGSQVDLERALATTRYDIVIADGFSAAPVAAIVQGGIGRPTLVPAFNKQSQKQMKSSANTCLISSAKASYHAVGEIDHVMSLRKAAAVVP